MLDIAQKAKGKNTARRFALYYYCFLVEMSAIHEIMINVLRCVNGRTASHSVFSTYQRRKKGSRSIPPSMPQKIKAVTDEAMRAGEADLTANIKYVFDEKLRNAVMRILPSLLTDDEFRIRERGPGSSVPLKDVDRKVNYSFRFLLGLLTAASNVKYVLRRTRNITNGKITKCRATRG